MLKMSILSQTTRCVAVGLTTKELEMIQTLKTLLLAVAMMFAVSATAEAALMGDTIDWQYYAFGGTYDYLGSPGSFVAGSTTSFFGGVFNNLNYGYFTISATDTQIIFDYSLCSPCPSTWDSSPDSLNSGGLYIQNGILLTDITSNPFSSVTVDAATNMSGFSISNVTFTANQLAVNWMGLSYDSSTRVVLDISSNASVPEPASILLLGSGLMGLAAWKRKRVA